MKASRPVLASASFVIGCLLLFLFDAVVARVVGVPLIFAGILLGVSAIATPEFLSGDRHGG